MDKPEVLNDSSSVSADGPLRILLIVNLPWDTRLGAVRVYSELADQWRAIGHSVTNFSLSEAFPDNPAGARFALQQFRFAFKAARFVRRNSGRLDVVDAVIGSLRGSKRSLGFNGLLVARSVGLYRLYQNIEDKAQSRWRRRDRGTLLGRILYRLFRAWSNRVSSQAIQNADLLMVPNEDEAKCLREDLRVSAPIIVQPYGLTALQRDSLKNAAASSVDRLSAKIISVVGMWAPRKGSLDWPALIRAVRRRLPEARFRFLGTVVDDEAKVRSELGPENSHGLELISRFSPNELPKLLSDCAIGAFPSYVEGFGLGIIEQLSARIPTLAFDVPGPRSILKEMPELLIPAMDFDRFADKLCALLQLDPVAYDALASKCVQATTAFDWTRIASDTIAVFRNHFQSRSGDGTMLFVQPFSIGSSGGGGARILRSLLETAPIPWRSVCCSPRRPRSWPNEVHLPTRPSWGKIETSRLARFPNMTMSIFARGFRRRLKALALESKATGIHTVPHSGLDFMHIQAVARDLSLPFFLSLHDDIVYTTARETSATVLESAMRMAWTEAEGRFVISKQLGEEYCRRYGSKPYQVVTDGLKHLAAGRRDSQPNTLRIYFMGLFHLGYERNLRALLEALVLLEGENPDITSNVTCRCEFIRPHIWSDIKPIDVLPFGAQEQIDNDMRKADLLYLPMPFGEEHERFARFSISTKMVTYIGSGIPIVYHGPPISAAYELLRREDAAIFITSLEPQEIATVLGKFNDDVRASVVANALRLAARDFMLVDQTQKFWGTICERITR